MPRHKRDEEQSLMENEGKKKKADHASWIPARYIFVALGCFGFANVYAMRVNLSVALVAMVNASALAKNGSDSNTECKAPNDTQSEISMTGEFNWDQETQGLILGSFFWGYIVTQLPGGRMAEMMSGKWLLGFGVLCTAVFTLLTPVAARNGIGYLMAVRVLEGLGEGLTFPAMHAMISRWSPQNERSRFVTIIFTGSLLGTVFGLPASGYLCLYGFDGGWPSVFYVFGAVGVFWFILWAVFAYDNPDCHPWISENEIIYIKRGRSFEHDKKEMLPLPWKEMATSLPLWAIAISHFGNNWGFYTLLTELPTYLQRILHFNMKQNSILSALPYFLSWLLSIIASVICDKLIEKNYLRTRSARKVFNSIGLIIPAGLLVALTFAGCDQTLSFTILVIAMSLNGSLYAGYMCNHIDIAPNFAGTLMGITNCLATIPGWVGPYVVGAFTKHDETRAQWAKVFYITAAIQTAAALFYLIFGRAEEQTWNRAVPEVKSDIEDEDQLYDEKKYKHISHL